MLIYKVEYHNLVHLAMYHLCVSVRFLARRTRGMPFSSSPCHFVFCVLPSSLFFRASSWADLSSSRWVFASLWRTEEMDG